MLMIRSTLASVPLFGLLLALPCPGQDADPPDPAVEVVEGDERHEALRSLFPGEIRPGQKQLVVKISPPKPAPESGDRATADPVDKAPAETTPAKPPRPETVRVVKFRGNRGIDKNLTVAATRAGDRPDIKLVALAPGDAGITLLERPTLWWFQSQDSKRAELEFILTEISSRPTELLRLPLKAMPAGFNSFNLGARWMDPTGIALQPGKQYQWTIALRAGDKSPAVYAKLRRVPDAALEELLETDPYSTGALEKLSESGNWYELLDTIALLVRRHPDEQAFTQIRNELFTAAKLSKHLP